MRAGSITATSTLKLDFRLDQAPGVWLTAAGIVPLALVDETRPDGPLDVTLTSSSVGLGVIEALTAAVREVSGTMRLNVRAIGTARDPRFTGTVGIQGAAFLVAATGVRYRNGAAAFQLAPDRVTVETLRVEDTRGRALTLVGSLGTRELRVGELAIDARARGLTVLANEFGNMEVDADLRLRGRADSPRVMGTVTVVGGEFDVDAILDRTLFRPYSTEATRSGASRHRSACRPESMGPARSRLRAARTEHAADDRRQRPGLARRAAGTRQLQPAGRWATCTFTRTPRSRST